MRKVFFMSLLLGLLVCAGMAHAGSIPNLVGVWKTAPSAEPFQKDGQQAGDRSADFYRGVEATLTITKQEGALFYGERTTPQTNDALAGVIDPDGKTIYMVDDKGIYICTLMTDIEAGKKVKKKKTDDDKPEPLNNLLVRYLSAGKAQKVVGIMLFSKTGK